MNTDVCDKIRLLRLSHNLTQEEMAEKLNLSPSGYAKIERCETDISMSRLDQIANTFNISVIDLLSFKQEVMPKTQVINFNDNATSKSHKFYLNDHQVQSSESYQTLSHEIEKLKLIVESQGKEIELLKTLLNIQRLNIND